MESGNNLAYYGDANDNWYFLPDLTINSNNSDTSKTTFVDNYWSLFGQPFNNDSYSNMLTNVVDVQLDPNQYQQLSDAAWRHSYAAFWYAGCLEAALTNKNKVGRAWSALTDKPSKVAAKSLSQNWLQSSSPNYPIQKQQFRLQSDSSFVVNPVINSVGLKNSNGEPAGSSVTLDASNATQTFTFTSADTGFSEGLRGLLFQYQFNDFKPGDKLSIYITTSESPSVTRLGFKSSLSSSHLVNNRRNKNMRPHCKRERSALATGSPSRITP